MELKNAILLNIKSISSLSPGGIELSWLTYLVSSNVDASQDEVRMAANSLVADEMLQQPFEGVYLLEGAKVLVARN